jgi:hypothetical protein
LFFYYKDTIFFYIRISVGTYVFVKCVPVTLMSRSAHFCQNHFPLFLAHLAKGHVSFCHHLASVVRRKLSHLNIFSNNSHLERRAGLSDTILKGTHPGTIPARFGLLWFRGFRGEYLNVKVYDVRRTPSDGKSYIPVDIIPKCIWKILGRWKVIILNYMVDSCPIRVFHLKSKKMCTCHTNVPLCTFLSEPFSELNFNCFHFLIFERIPE